MENPYINPQTYYPTMNNGYASLRRPIFLLNIITQQDQPTRRILPFVTKEGISSRKCWSCWGFRNTVRNTRESETRIHRSFCGTLWLCLRGRGLLGWERTNELTKESEGEEAPGNSQAAEVVEGIHAQWGNSGQPKELKNNKVNSQFRAATHKRKCSDRKAACCSEPCWSFNWPMYAPLMTFISIIVG